MAHNLSFFEGEAEMFYVNDQKPWHGLGTPVDNALTAEEAIKAAHLGWEVEKRKIFFEDYNNIIPANNGFMTVRTDTITPLGIVSDRYQVIQNSEAFDFMDTLVYSGEAKYITAGALFSGKKVWLLCLLPGYIKVGKKDLIKKYLLLCNSHDGTACLVILLTPIRVVCNNTLNAALQKADTRVNIHHTGNIENKIAQARKTLGIAVNYYELIERVFNRFYAFPLSDKELGDYIDSIFTSDTKVDENRINKIMELYHTGAGHELAEGTLWGAYNAVTEFIDHHYIDYIKKPDKYINSITFGRGAEIKELAFKKALAFVS